MKWPPINLQTATKIREHSAWYSGEPNNLANFYEKELAKNIFGLPYTLNRDLFWARQIKNDSEIGLHVPIAGDIASTSADLLFSESPSIKIAEAHEEKAAQSYKEAQDTLDTMLEESGFYRKILECAETCAAMGGGYIKLAWDTDLSPYPIPVVEQIDNAIPTFKFGVLTEVVFWKVVDKSEDGTKVYRLLETYAKDGTISYKLYKGNDERLGYEISMPENLDYEDVSTSIKDILTVYIPNILPNRLDRSSCLGRSDYLGVEGLMDSLDETYSSWMKDILLAQGKVMIPAQYLEKSETGFRYNIDRMIFAKLDIDPILEGNSMTSVQFAIRATEFEQTALNLLERIISSAGYSPQSFGLSIQGRAESGTALSIRERKSFATKGKKEAYWEPALKKLTSLMLALYKLELKGVVEADVSITTQFSDSITNNVTELSAAVQQISAAYAASTATKVKLLHPEWSADEVTAEVELIIKENNLGPQEEPDDFGSVDDTSKEDTGDDEK